VREVDLTNEAHSLAIIRLTQTPSQPT
jgi:hypothetical protein